MRPISEHELAHVNGGDLPIVVVAGPKPNPWLDLVFKPNPPQPMVDLSSVLTGVILYH